MVSYFIAWFLVFMIFLRMADFYGIAWYLISRGILGNYIL